MSPLRALDAAAHWLGRLLTAFLLWLIFVQTVVRLVRRYWHFPVPHFVAAFLSSPIRKAVQPPEEVVERSGIGHGMTALELGPGPGTFTLEAARRVGPQGTDAARVETTHLSPAGPKRCVPRRKQCSPSPR